MSVAIDIDEFGDGATGRRSRQRVLRRAGARHPGESTRPAGGRVSYRTTGARFSRTRHSTVPAEPGWPTMIAGVLATALVLLGLFQLGQWRSGDVVAPAEVTHVHSEPAPNAPSSAAG